MTISVEEQDQSQAENTSPVCCNCNALATRTSPGGDSYCTKHGRCASCQGNVEWFVPYHIGCMQIHVCPCVAANVDQRPKEEPREQRKVISWAEAIAVRACNRKKRGRR